MARASIALDNKQLIFLVTYESVAKTRKITLPMGISLNQIVVENAPIGKKVTILKKPPTATSIPNFAVKVDDF